MTDEFLKKKNVIGYADTKDCVEVYVTKKYDEATAQRLISNPKIDFWESDLVPKFVTKLFKKKKTKVIEVGRVKAHSDSKKYRPLKGGCEIGISGDNYFGTAGGLVYRRSYGGLQLYGAWETFFDWIIRNNLEYTEEKFILTNCHVAQKDVSKPKQWTYIQPYRASGGYVIGTENESHLISFETDNYIDAAIIKLKDVDMLPEQVPGWKIKGFNTFISAADSLKKYGRTTEATEGRLLTSRVNIQVEYRTGVALFRNVYRATGMSGPGDSGSFVLNQNDEVVGLIFAGAGEYSYIIPIREVLKRFRLSTKYI